MAYNEMDHSIPPTLLFRLKIASEHAGYSCDLAEKYKIEGNEAYAQFENQRSSEYQKIVMEERATINAFLAKKAKNS